MTAPAFTYAATVVSVHDDDTLTAVIDLGFHVSFATPMRLFGINAPELAAPQGPAARDHLASLLKVGRVVVKTFKDPTDKYGRWLAEVDAAGVNVCDQMVTDGFALPWDGNGPKPVQQNGSGA